MGINPKDDTRDKIEKLNLPKLEKKYGYLQTAIQFVKTNWII